MSGLKVLKKATRIKRAVEKIELYFFSTEVLQRSLKITTFSTPIINYIRQGGREGEKKKYQHATGLAFNGQNIQENQV